MVSIAVRTAPTWAADRAAGGGLADVRVAARATWHEAYTRVFRTALELGDHGDDTALAELRDEAKEQLPTADLVRRVVVTATAPRRSAA